MESSNLTPEYVQFVKEGGNINALVQQVIDRSQYLPGFLDELNALLGRYENPFEEVVTAGSIEEAMEGIEAVVTGNFVERRLRSEYCK